MGSIPQLSIVKGKQSLLQPRLLHKTFEDRVDKTFGEKTALIFHDENGEERETNYNTLNSSANRIASALLSVIKSRGLQANGDGDWIVAVCMKPSDNLVTSLLSIWKCGGNNSSSLALMIACKLISLFFVLLTAAYLPLDVTFPANRISHILNESKPVLVIMC